ncbi:MAG TPA: hypothetical protein VEY71_04300 [Chitinophagales bacterium]|nr:hypothetical protein [Chitinophagales bacterium]
MGHSLQPPINEVINLLEAYAPAELQDLKKTYPEQENALRRGINAGETPAPNDGRVGTQDELYVRVVATIKGLELVIRKCNEVQPMLKTRLRNLGKVQFVSQLVVALSGATLLAMLQKENNILFNTISGSLTLCGAILTLFVQHRSGTVVPGSRSLFQLYDPLVDNKIAAEHSLQELSIAVDTYQHQSKEKVAELVSKSNGICWEMKKLLDLVE